MAKDAASNTTAAGRVEALPMRVHSILNRIEPSRPAHQRYGFSYTLNPYRGCTFACRYCYARYTHEWLGLDGDADFDQKIRLKQDIAMVLDRDLKKLRRGRSGSGGGIAIGTATDPYQPLEKVYGLTRACLQVLAQEEGLKLQLTTKSNLALRDLELFRKISKRNEFTVHVTVTTLDRALARSLEPGAPSPRARIETIAALTAAGIRVEPFVCPLIPGLTDAEGDLERLFAELSLAGASRVICEAIFLRSPTKEVFFRHLEKEAPDLLERYRRRFADSAFLSPIEVERLKGRVARLRRKFGLTGAAPVEDAPLARVPRRGGPRRLPRRGAPLSRPRQLGLFG